MINADKILSEIFKELEKEVIEDVQSNLQANFERNSFTGFSPNSTTLSSQRGFNQDSLVESYRIGNKNTLSKISSNSSGIDLKLESGYKWAWVHEKGAFIKSKGKMHLYFLSQYKQKKLSFYKITALSVLKKGGVNIPKRPFLNFNNLDVKAIELLFLEKLERKLLES